MTKTDILIEYYITGRDNSMYPFSNLAAIAACLLHKLKQHSSQKNEKGRLDIQRPFMSIAFFIAQ
jgi:hypothetical protein